MWKPYLQMCRVPTSHIEMTLGATLWPDRKAHAKEPDSMAGPLNYYLNQDLLLWQSCFKLSQYLNCHCFCVKIAENHAVLTARYLPPLRENLQRQICPYRAIVSPCRSEIVVGIHGCFSLYAGVSCFERQCSLFN